MAWSQPRTKPKGFSSPGENCIALAAVSIVAKTILGSDWSGLIHDTEQDMSESQTRRTYFVLDEMADAGRLATSSLLKKSRSKGRAAQVAFQSNP